MRVYTGNGRGVEALGRALWSTCKGSEGVNGGLGKGVFSLRITIIKTNISSTHAAQ